MDEGIREISIEHLNFTKNFHDILNVNSNEELKNSVHVLEDEFIDKSFHDAIVPHSAEKVIMNSPIQVKMDRINVEIDFKESNFYIVIYGTILEFLFNGADIIRTKNLR